jgi:hypothetical protein
MPSIPKVSILAAALLGISCGSSQAEPEAKAIDLAARKEVPLSSAHGRPRVELVKLQGKVFYFGTSLLDPANTPPYGTGVAGARVWLAEYPFTRHFNVTSDADGVWSMWVLKFTGEPLELSFVYEKDFYPPAVEQAVFGAPLPAPWDVVTIKSNVHAIQGCVSDLAVQMPDELYLSAAKRQLEQGLQGYFPGFAIQNLMVSTVGKSWASLYSFDLPHGDPGATVSISPPLTNLYGNLPSGPIYFDASVTPNPALTTTSVDGGVLFDNLAPGTYTVTAAKDPFSYATVKFEVDPAIPLYISSPPHSIQGTNGSAPGEP